MLVAIESLVGLLGFGLVAGLMFARFSRPQAAIIFSRFAVVAPYHGITALMFRIANQRSSQIVELEAKVFLSRRRDGATHGEREFVQLKLERDRVSFFPLAWTVVHPIDEASPLYGRSRDDLVRSEAEFVILLSGFEETFSQTVHTRSSYRAGEVVFGARFRSIFNTPGRQESLSIDVRRLHDIERL